MAVVRELITVLGATVDHAGFKEYETGIERLKSLALSTAKMFGIAFSIDKIIEFADELVKTGKEVNKIRLELNLIARPFDDMEAAQQRVFETAQELGVAYKDVFETFKQFSTEMRETKIPQDQILQTTRNLYEAIRVERTSPEKTAQIMEIFERTFKRGAMRSVGVGQLFGLSPEIFSMLEKAFNTNEEGLRDLAKEGKITAEAIVQAFGVANKELDDKFAKVPIKIGQAFQIIYNDLVNVTAQIYKMTEMSSFFGNIILYVWRQFRTAVIAVSDAVGGLKNLIMLLGIAIGVAIGPATIRSMILIVSLMGRWVALNWTLILQWGLMAAGVIAVAFAISDLVFWMQGKRSVIGTWVGPFKDLAENFKKLDIFSGFRLFGDAWKGDWDAFKKDWDTFIKDTPAQILIIVAAVGTIATAFWLIIPAIRGVIAAIELIGPASKAAAVAAEAGGKGAAVAAAAAGGKGKAGPRAGGLATALSMALLGWSFAEDTNMVNTGIDKGRLDDAALGALIGRMFGPMGALAGGVGGAMWRKPDWAPEWMNKSPEDFIIPLLKRAWVGPQAIQDQNRAYVPTVPPGAFNPNAGPRVGGNTEILPTLNQTNNIHVETLLDADQIGKVVSDKMAKSGDELINSLTRDLQRAGPRVEKATQ